MGSGPSEMSKASLAPSCDVINMHAVTERDEVGTHQLLILG